MVFVLELNLAFAKVEYPPQRKESLRRDVPWRGHPSRFPLVFYVQQFTEVVFTAAPRSVVVLLEKERPEAERIDVLPAVQGVGILLVIDCYRFTGFGLRLERTARELIFGVSVTHLFPPIRRLGVHWE